MAGKRRGRLAASLKKQLKEAWYDVKSPIAYTGISRLLTRFPKRRNEVKTWGSKQEGYTLHRPAIRKFPRRKILVPFVDYQFEADLIDVSSYASQNDHVKFLLSCIDVLSKRAFVRPLLNKAGKSVAEGLDSIFLLRRCWFLGTDRGKEWINPQVKAVCEKWDVHHYFCRDPIIHCPVIERFNRTIQERISRFQTSNNTRRYVDALEDIVHGYNHSVHRTIGMRPVDVTRGESEKKAYRNMLRAKGMKGRKSTPLQVGDRVRLLLPFRYPFHKGYDISWTRQIFTVSERLSRREPEMYRLQDDAGDALPRTYYSQELQKVLDPESYAVDRVLDTRIDPNTGKRQYLVRWLGYEGKFDSWVDDLWRLGAKNPAST